MQLELWVAYVLAILVMMSTPGPSHLLMLSNSLAHGFKPATATAFGDLSANTLQMILASLGLASAIKASANTFIIIKWLGVTYLVYLGLKLIFSTQEKTTSKRNESNRKHLYWQGFITSASNPKAIIFFAALFPLFIDTQMPIFRQFLILTATYLFVDGVFLMTYGRFAGLVREKMTQNAFRNLSRLSGTLMIVAAILLGLRSIEA